MRINGNIVANYASRLWSGVASFIFVPAYLRLLGPEPFGLIGFSTSLLGLLFVLDMGMSNGLAREISRDRAPAALADLLRSLETIYLAIVVAVILAALLAAGPIADHWLNVSSLSPTTVRNCVALMLSAGALQVMMSLYIGGLLGANRHVTAAAFQIGFGVVRSGLVLVPLLLYPSIEVFFIWQLAASFVFLLVIRSRVWAVLAPASRPRFSGAALSEIGAFMGGMSGIALIAAINTQSDKLVVSRVFTLHDLGQYAVASLIGQIPSMLALPLAVTVLPRLTGHVARGERNALVDTYMLYSVMIGAVAMSAAAGVVASAPALLTVMMGAPPSAELVAVARVLGIGGALLAVQYMPYHLAIAYGHTCTSLILGIISALVLPIAMTVATTQSGLIGAAIPWLAMNMVVAVILAWQVTPRYLGPFLTAWARRSILTPALLGSGAVALVWPLLSSIANPWISLAITGVACAAGLGANMAVLGRTRRQHSLNPSPLAREP